MRNLILALIFLIYTAPVKAGLSSLYTGSRFNCFTERSSYSSNADGTINLNRTIDHKNLVKVCSKYAKKKSVFARQEWASTCSPDNKRTRYDLELSGSSVILKQHLVFSIGDITTEDRKFFIQILKQAVPLIRTWFMNHGIIYLPQIYNKFDEESFDFAGSPLGKTNIFLIEQFGRSEANATGSTSTIFLYSEDSKTRNFSSPKEFAALFIHENLHLLGLPDNYKDPGNCVDFNPGSAIVKNIHAGLGEYQKYLYTENIMSTQIVVDPDGIKKDLFRLGLPTDYLYDLIAPLCPNLCDHKNEINGSL